MTNKTKKILPPIRIPSAKNEDQPATRKMLYLVRDELRSEIRTLDRKWDSKFKSLDSKFSGIDSRFATIDARFAEIDARFNKVDARFADIDARFDEMKSLFEEMRADNLRTHILLEEQHSNNRIVLEGLQGLWQRQERIEQRLG